MQVNAGQIIWRPEDASDCFYIVINGRLRAITETEKGDVSIVGEYGQGDAVGELDVITSSPRQNTLHAIRDTELIRMPQTLFNALSMRCVSKNKTASCQKSLSMLFLVLGIRGRRSSEFEPLPFPYLNFDLCDQNTAQDRPPRAR